MRNWMNNFIFMLFISVITALGSNVKAECYLSVTKVGYDEQFTNFWVLAKCRPSDQWTTITIASTPFSCKDTNIIYLEIAHSRSDDERAGLHYIDDILRCGYFDHKSGSKYTPYCGSHQEVRYTLRLPGREMANGQVVYKLSTTVSCLQKCTRCRKEQRVSRPPQINGGSHL